MEKAKERNLLKLKEKSENEKKKQYKERTLQNHKRVKQIEKDREDKIPFETNDLREINENRKKEYLAELKERTKNRIEFFELLKQEDEMKMQRKKFSRAEQDQVISSQLMELENKCTWILLFHSVS